MGQTDLFWQETQNEKACVSLNLYPEDATQFLRNCAPNDNTCQPPFDTCYTQMRPDGPSFSGYKELYVEGVISYCVYLSLLSVKVTLSFLCAMLFMHRGWK